MSTRRLDRCDVPSPCPVSWNSMNGTDVTRTCATCARQVHDLSAMTLAESEALIFSSTERICVRYVRAADGVIQTKDHPARMIQAGPYAGLSAAALATAIALSQPACSTPATQPAANEQQDRTPDRSRGVGRPGSGTLSGHVDTYGNHGFEGARVVAISESTGEEYSTQSMRDGEFSLELPAGRYTISVTDDVAAPTGEGGVEVRPGEISTKDFEVHAPVVGEVIRLYPDTPPPPLPELNEPPIASSSPKSSIGEAWNRVVQGTKRLLR